MFTENAIEYLEYILFNKCEFHIVLENNFKTSIHTFLGGYIMVMPYKNCTRNGGFRMEYGQEIHDNTSMYQFHSFFPSINYRYNYNKYFLLLFLWIFRDIIYLHIFNKKVVIINCLMVLSLSLSYIYKTFSRTELAYDL